MVIHVELKDLGDRNKKANLPNIGKLALLYA